MPLPILKSGSVAYYDSFSGLIPVKVLKVVAPKEKPLFDLCSGLASASIGVTFEISASIGVTCEITKNHGPYKKGEILNCNSLHVAPRKAIRTTKYSYVIGMYSVQPD